MAINFHVVSADQLNRIKSSVFFNYLRVHPREVIADPLIDRVAPEAWRTALGNYLAFGISTSAFAHVKPKYIPPKPEAKAEALSFNEWLKENNLELPADDEVDPVVLEGVGVFADTRVKALKDRYSAYISGILASIAEHPIVDGGYLDEPIWIITSVVDYAVPAEEVTSPIIDLTASTVWCPKISALGNVSNVVVLLPDNLWLNTETLDELQDVWSEALESTPVQNVFFVDRSTIEESENGTD